jgi:hypothetical protein
METKTYRLIVAGGREFDNKNLLSTKLWDYAENLEGDWEIELVSGMAKGADKLAWEFARENRIICHEFPANWDKYGNSAGYKRNVEMANFSDALIAFWDGESRGTMHMINIMRNKNKPVEIVLY